jgi:GT2 family glycosyltransferase
VISAVVPTYHGAERLARNLASVVASLAAGGEAWEVVVVDDGGGGDLDLPAGARLVTLAANQGYGPAVNAGARAARGDYLLVLNDDVRLDPKCVKRLRSHFPDPSLFAVVPAIRSGLAACGDEGGKAGVWRAGMIEIEEVAADREHTTLYPVGCCYLAPRSAFLALGGYDDAFAPFFFEDTDLGYRAWCSGLRILHVPSAVCDHEGSATLREQRSFELRERVFHRNRILFHLRNLREPRLRAECLGACAALALFEAQAPRRAGLAEALEPARQVGRLRAEGLSDEEVLSRSRGA